MTLIKDSTGSGPLRPGRPTGAIGSPPGLPMAADLYCELVGPGPAPLRDHLPGLLVTLLALLAALFISARYGAPATLMALLIGLSLNFLSVDKRLQPGLDFAATRLLRFGIVLLGARVTLGQIADLGPLTLLAIALILTVTMLAGLLFARLLGYGSAFGVLAGGAVAICGASAALGLAAVLGERRVNRAELTIVLIGIAAMSALAMFLYPILAHWLDMSGQQAGFFLGASIHDVAQALGAGFGYSDSAGDNATIVKLARVALLAPVLAIVGLVFPSGEKMGRVWRNFPWFVLGFLALAAINSTGLIPHRLDMLMADAGSLLVIAAVAAAGIRSPMAKISSQGARPLLVLGGATLAAAGCALGASWLLF